MNRIATELIHIAKELSREAASTTCSGTLTYNKRKKFLSFQCPEGDFSAGISEDKFLSLIEGDKVKVQGNIYVS